MVGFLLISRKYSFRYAEKMGYPKLQHCLLPKIGAVQTMLDCTVGGNGDPKCTTLHPQLENQLNRARHGMYMYI